VLLEVSPNVKKEQPTRCEFEVSGTGSETLSVLLRTAEGVDEDFEAAARRFVVSEIDTSNIR
jgi:hypothetical protein